MRILRYPLVLLVVVALFVALFGAATAQDASVPLVEVTRAIELIEDSDYRFSYQVYPNVDATSRITGEGERDADSQNWRYTVASDPADPNANRANDGEWLVIGNIPHHNTAEGWVMAMDFTHMGIGSAPTPFAMYESLLSLVGPDSEDLEPLTLVGRETVDGVEADHYTFATTEVPMLGTGRFDIWLTPEGEGFSRVIVQTTSGERVNRVVYYDIGQDVTVEAPQ